MIENILQVIKPRHPLRIITKHIPHLASCLQWTVNLNFLMPSISCFLFMVFLLAVAASSGLQSWQRNIKSWSITIKKSREKFHFKLHKLSVKANVVKK